MARRGKLRRVDPQRKTQRRDRPDPRDRGQPPTHRVGPVLLHQRGIDRPQPRLDALGFAAEQRDRLLRRRRHRRLIGRGDLGLQLGQALPAERCHDPHLGGMAAHRIDELGALPHQQLANRQQHGRGLLRGRLDRHAADRRLGGGHADRLGIVAVVLAALDKRFDILRRDQPHAVAQRQQGTAPVMRPAARFQHHLDRRQPFKEPQQLTPPQIAPQYRSAAGVNPMQRKHRLGRIDGNARNLGHGRSPVRIFDDRTLAPDAAGPSTPTCVPTLSRKRCSTRLCPALPATGGSCICWRAPDTEPAARRCRSSVVEHSLGKGEVESSILSGSTILRADPNYLLGGGKGLRGCGDRRPRSSDPTFAGVVGSEVRASNRVCSRARSAGPGGALARRRSP